MALKEEFELAEKQINGLIIRYKFNSDDYDLLGMLDENNALIIIDGCIKIVRNTLETITKEYSLNKKKETEIRKFIEKIKTKLEHDILNEDILVHDYGCYINKYDVREGRTLEEAQRDFIYMAREKLDKLDIQRLRVSNFRTRARSRNWKEWLPIIISVFSLVVSIIVLLR